MAEYIDKTIGDYHILEAIAAGGMGQVYLAENIHHKKRYALKILPDQLGKDVNFRKRFFDEARVMSELNHPGIVRVQHMGEFDGLYYLVMDYVQGPEGRPCSLHAKLGQSPNRRLDQEAALACVSEICQALAYAHQRGIIHRDIKPANILVTQDEHVKITDFGLAKAIGADFIMSQIHSTMASLGDQPTIAQDTEGGGHQDSLDAQQTIDSDQKSSRRSSGSTGILGTYDYMSPEQREPGAVVDQRSDIYSLGVMVYRILTGKRPVGMAKPPSRVVKGLSLVWDQIVEVCLEEDPAERYQDVDALLHDLSPLLAPESQEVQEQIQPSTRTTSPQVDGVSSPISGKDWQIPTLDMALAYVAPGSFQMGSNDGDGDEKPVHTVRISQGYWMAKYEATQQQYQSIMGDNPSNFKGSSNPVEKVSWNDCVSFCKKLTDQERRAGRLPEGYDYRLPTEAEWEYAARGGSRGRDTKYAGSDSIDFVAWYGENSGRKTHPVGQKQGNELGLFDMSGNVWEWCYDWYGSYSSGSQTDPAGSSTGSSRVLRGGGWGNDASRCRVAYRIINAPARTGNILGFRVVLASPVR